MKNFLNKFKYFILGGIVIMAGTIYAANLQPSFTPSLIPVEDSKYYLGTTTPSLRAYLRVIADSFYDTDASDGCAQWASNVLTSNGSDCGSGTVGSGTQGQFPFYNAAGTTLTATSTLFLSQAGRIGIGQETPLNLLHLKAAAGSVHQRFEDATAGLIGFIGGANGLITGSAAGNMVIRAESGLYLSGRGNSTADMFISSVGSVGVGINTPGAK